jgi:hypothetical protein
MLLLLLTGGCVLACKNSFLFSTQASRLHFCHSCLRALAGFFLPYDCMHRKLVQEELKLFVASVRISKTSLTRVPIVPSPVAFCARQRTVVWLKAEHGAMQVVSVLKLSGYPCCIISQTQESLILQLYVLSARLFRHPGQIDRKVKL